MKKKLVIGFYLAILLIIILIITAIFLVKQKSLVTDTTCAFPCWNNVKLGETNKAELLKILTNVSSINQASIFSQKPLGNYFDDSIYFERNLNLMGAFGGNSGQALFLNNKVFELAFFGDTGITLEQAIQRLGTPDHVYTSPIGEAGGFDIRVFFKEKGVVVGFFVNFEGDIVPSQNIDSVNLVDPNSYQKILESGEFTVGLDYKKLIPWDGYGKVKDKYWRP